MSVRNCNMLIYVSEGNQITFNSEGLVIDPRISPCKPGWYVVTKVYQSKRDTVQRAVNLCRVESIDNSMRQVKYIIETFGASIVPFEVLEISDNDGHAITVYRANAPLKMFDDTTCFVFNKADGYVSGHITQSIMLSNTKTERYSRFIERLSSKDVARIVYSVINNDNSHSLSPLNDLMVQYVGDVMTIPINATEAPIRSKYFNMYHVENHVVDTEEFFLQYSPYSAIGEILEFHQSTGYPDEADAPWLYDLHEMIIRYR